MINQVAKPYIWRGFIMALVPTCIATTLVAMLLDQVLIELGVNIHPYFEAIVAGSFSLVLSALAVPLLWRLGLRTLPQYLLGGLALIVPATLLSLFAIALYSPVTLNVSGMSAEVIESQVWAVTIYVRFTRSAILLPVHIFSFWLFYHKLFNFAPKEF